jgi:DNA-binding LacI/PurR family transcriptional regulator
MNRSRVTLGEVAGRAGVSPMTASYTYNRPERVSEEARAKVLAAAAELGYAGPDAKARSLRRGSSRTVGVVLGEQLSYAFEDPGAAAFLSGVARVCAAAGYGVTILPITGAADDARRIHETSADGFIVWTTVDGDPVLSAVVASGRPGVVHGGPATEGLALVGIDDAAAARQVGLVAFAGARRPAVLSFPLDRRRIAGVVRGPATTAARVPFPVTRDRLRGYRTAARARGHSWSDVVVSVCARNDADEAERAARSLLSGPHRPDAIAAMGDELAGGVMRAARTLGVRVPQDLAVTGWDDSRRARELKLTTVAQSLAEQGAACADFVLGAEPARDFSAAWTVVERGSTAANAARRPRT